MWSFFLMTACLVVGAALLLTVAVWVTMSVYALAYLIWLGWHKGEGGIPRKLPSSSLTGMNYLRHNMRNATKLYRSWFSHTPHGITDW